jgi:hypothetical protein
MKTITQDMRDRAAQITKIIEDAGVLKDYAVHLAVFKDKEGREIEIIVTRAKGGKLRRVSYSVYEKSTYAKLVSATIYRKFPCTRIDAEALSEDLRWLLGEDTE